MNRCTWLAAAGAALLFCGVLETPGLAEDITVSSRRNQVFTSIESTRARAYLADRPVLPASETVTIDGLRLERDQDYRIDYAQGIIYLARDAAPGSVMRVSYSILPVMLKPLYQLRMFAPNAAGGAPAQKSALETTLRPTSSAYDLRASGSKVISVEAGSLNDFRVSQALNLSIGGKVGDGVEVKGVLSDKDMSLSDQATTTRLQDLDHVFLEVRSPQAYARVGDLEIDENPGQLLSFRRSLTGFLGDASYGSERLVLSGAQSRSKYETVEITGQEGISGPYRIGGQEGEDLGVVANSEKVWLDGEPMKRGRNADYVIDYTTGEIYFNPSHLIREGVRIVIDYESQSDSAKRQFYFARSSTDIGKKANLAVSFLNEGSDRLADGSGLDPLFASGGSAGSDAQGWTDGGKFVGFGTGSYILVHKDSLTYYQYAGEGNGDYDVTFTWVGEGKGTYSYLYSERWQQEIHVYTGNASGAYVDRIATPARLSSQVIHVSASAKPADGLEVTSEFAESRGDKKPASGPWEFVQDKAYLVGLKGTSDLPQLGGHQTGAIELTANRRWIGEGYLALARLRSPGVLERWAQDPGDGFEATNEMSLTYRLGTGVATSVELGSMGTQGGDSRRQKYTVDLGTARMGLAASSEAARLVAASGDKGSERTSLEFHFPLRFVDFQIGRTSDVRERLTDQTSLSTTEYYSKAKASAGGDAVALTLSRDLEDKEQGAGWQAYSSSLDGKLEFETDQARRAAVHGQIAHRRISYAPIADLGQRRMTSADLGLTLRDVLVVSSLALDYGLANTLTSVYASKLVKVGPGGDYDSLGKYVPGAGNYDITRYESGKQPVSSMKTGLTIETGLKGRILLERMLSSRTTVEIEGESSNGNLARLALPDPGYVFDARQVVYGQANFGEELVINRLKGITLAVSGGLARSLDARCPGQTEKDVTTRFETRLSSSSLRKTSATASWRFTSTARDLETGEARIQPSSDTWVASTSLERALSNAFRGRMTLEVSNEDRDPPHATILDGSFSPGLTVFWGGLRCDAGVTVTRLLSSRAATQLLLLSRDSVDWNSRINLRQGRYTSLAFEYVGRKTRGVPTLHNLRASLSATF